MHSASSYALAFFQQIKWLGASIMHAWFQPLWALHILHYHIHTPTCSTHIQRALFCSHSLMPRNDDARAHTWHLYIRLAGPTSPWFPCRLHTLGAFGQQPCTLTATVDTHAFASSMCMA
jgi:hypothetical protein